MLLVADIEPAFLAQQLVAGSQSFSLLAIPLFMLAGELMTAGGLSQRLIDVAGVLVRHRTGGLAMVAVLAALVFSAISGSAPATTAAIGAILIPAMARAGYDKAFAAAIAVSAGVLGPLIPPSIAFVIWGIVAEQSIGKLFLSGIVPGLAIARSACWWSATSMPGATTCRKQASVRAGAKPRAAFARRQMGAAVAARRARRHLWRRLHADRGCRLSCIYAVLVGLFVERQMSFKALPDIFLRSVRTSAIVTRHHRGLGGLWRPDRAGADRHRLRDWLASHVTEKWMALAGLNIAFFLLAAVMDEIAIMVILGPMLIAIADQIRRRSDPFRRDHRHQRCDRHGGAADRLLPVRRHGDPRAQPRPRYRGRSGRISW